VRPKAVGPYAILDELGQGGMGRVFLAERDGQRFALKLAHEQLAAAPNMVARFLREAKAGIAIDHPNVVRTLDSGEYEGLPYLVMEFVQGRDLREHLSELGRIPEALLREVARQGAAGLAAIHATGVIHRDIKPENILITETNEIRIMDLGVAALQEATTTLTRDGGFAGSLLYAAPEQFRSESVGPATDRYSFGVVLYEMASGSNPFVGADAAAVIQRHLTHVPPSLMSIDDAISPFFSGLVAALLEKDCDARLTSTDELVDLLGNGESSAWWSAQERPRERPHVPVTRETGLVGRTQELGRLQAAWDEARAGRGGALQVLGEPGIGKTRLLDEMLSRAAADDAHLLYGAFTPRGGVRAFGDALEARLQRTPDLAGAFASRALGEPPPAGAPDLTRDAFAMMAGRTAFALAEQKPLLFILDDGQFADETALAALDELARIAGDVPMLLVVAATEPQDLDVPSVELRRLGARDVIELLSDVLRNRALAERLGGTIAAKSDGVPHFVLELLHSLKESKVLRRDASGVATAAARITRIEVPSTVRGLIDLRLEDLDDDDRDLLDVAALQGPVFDPGLVAQVLDRKRVHVLRRLAALERRTGMVHAEGGRYRFDQRQLQETLEAELESELKREYHELLREAYEKTAGEGGEDAVFLAYHGLRGTDPDQGRRWLDKALGHLHGAGRGEEFLHLGETALGVPGLFEGEERAELLLRMDANLAMLGSLNVRKSRLDEALSLAVEPALRARALNCLAAFSIEAGDPDQARAYCEEMQRAAVEAGDTKLEAHALGGIGIVLDRTDRYDEALTFLEASVALAESHDDEVGEMIGANNLGLLLTRMNRDEEALRYIHRALELARKLGRRRAEAALLGNLAMMACNAGDDARLERYAEECLAICHETGNRLTQLYVLNHLSRQSYMLGRSAECLGRLQHQLEMARDLSDRRLRASALDRRGGIRSILGHVDEALDDYAEAAELARQIQESYATACSLLSRARLFGFVNRMEEAQATARDAMEVAAEHGHQMVVAEIHLALAEWADDPRPHLRDAREALPENSPDRELYLRVAGAALADGDRAAAAEAIRQHRPPLAKLVELHQWLLLGEGEEARRVAQYLVDHAPPGEREPMVERSPLLRRALATA
jgi:tetratricopeptide (TPR) repeat protein/predicted Ser/Thr protein kinase